MEPKHCTILGGGVAGLAVAHFARRAGLSCTLFEAAPRLGGSARTLVASLPGGEFRYDTGAHRFHDIDPVVTAEVRGLLGHELGRVSAPSRIYHRGRFVDFPLRARNLVESLGTGFCLRAGAGLGWTRLFPPGEGSDFASMALRRYGPAVARPFLLDYTEKLYGRPGAQLSPAIAGRRLRGLHLRRFLREMLAGPGTRAGTMEGAFLYPHGGIGRLAEALAESAGPDRLHTATPVTAIRHNGTRVTALRIVGCEAPVDATTDPVVSTLPLGELLELLDPRPPDSVLAAARSLKFRDVVLVAVFLDRESVTPNATVYFPGPEFPFTRVCEPRNRSAGMAPPGKTALVAEIPVDAVASRDERVAGHAHPPSRSDESWLSPAVDALGALGWARKGEILGTAVHRIRHAYPVLDLGIASRLGEAVGWMSRLENLRIAGRAGTFTYSHLHDQLAEARDLVTEMTATAPGLFLCDEQPGDDNRSWKSSPDSPTLVRGHST